MKKRPAIETERLMLRQFVLADAKDVQRLAGDWAIAEMTLHVPHPYEDGMAEEWIATHQPNFEAGELCNFAIALRASGELIGAIGLTINRDSDRAELGYWIGKPFWGKGYCTEAARAVLQCGFSDLKLNRIHSSHYARNPASGRVLQKLGMEYEGLRRQHIKKWDRFEDLVLYGILRDEWLSMTEQCDRP